MKKKEKREKHVSSKGLKIRQIKVSSCPQELRLKRPKKNNMVAIPPFRILE